MNTDICAPTTGIDPLRSIAACGGVRERDRRRVRLLADRYAGALYRAARRLTGCHEEAEDLVQETFTRAWRARATFRPGGNARAWLFAIMTNVRTEALRKTRHAPPVADVSDGEFNEGLDDLECPVTRHIEGPEEAVLNAQPSEEVEAVLRQVPEHYRSAFLLAEVEHFSYQEISRMLGVPIGTVRSRVARGRRFLEQALWDYCVRSGVCRVPAPTTARGTWLPACRAACRRIATMLTAGVDAGAWEQVKAHLADCRACCDRVALHRRLWRTCCAQQPEVRGPNSLRQRLADLVSAF